MKKHRPKPKPASRKRSAPRPQRPPEPRFKTYDEMTAEERAVQDKAKRGEELTPEEMALLPPPPVPRGFDLRDVPVPTEFLVEMAMKEFGVSREEAVATMLEVQAHKHGAKGNA